MSERFLKFGSSVLRSLYFFHHFKITLFTLYTIKDVKKKPTCSDCDLTATYIWITGSRTGGGLPISLLTFFWSSYSDICFPKVRFLLSGEIMLFIQLMFWLSYFCGCVESNAWKIVCQRQMRQKPTFQSIESGLNVIIS